MTITIDGVGRIAQERQRQRFEEGWTPEHDAEHDKGEMIAAAIAYAMHAEHGLRPRRNSSFWMAWWPWGQRWWKPKDPMTDLIRAGALIAAEIDRLILKGEADATS